MPSDDRDGKKGIRIRQAQPKKKINVHYIIRIFLMTFALSLVLSLFSSTVLSAVNVIIAFILLFFFIALGVLFDVLGTSVTAADETPFHSMSARKVPGAKEAVRLIRNSEKVAKFCNDVVGDIAGVLTGSLVALILEVATGSLPHYVKFFVSLAGTATVAALTVGGKAVGKFVAINNSNTIIYFAARVILFFKGPFTRKEKDGSV